jgi:hypothetical protein
MFNKLGLCLDAFFDWKPDEATKAGSPENYEKSLYKKINREDREDREEDIEEADGTSAQLEIGKQLGSMDGIHPLDSFILKSMYSSTNGSARYPRSSMTSL